MTDVKLTYKFGIAMLKSISLCAYQGMILNRIINLNNNANVF